MIDLLPGFRAKLSRTTAPLFVDGWHPDPAGHRVAAEALAGELARQGLLPAGRLRRYWT